VDRIWSGIVAALHAAYVASPKTPNARPLAAALPPPMPQARDPGHIPNAASQNPVQPHHIDTLNRSATAPSGGAAKPHILSESKTVAGPRRENRRPRATRLRVTVFWPAPFSRTLASLLLPHCVRPTWLPKPRSPPTPHDSLPAKRLSSTTSITGCGANIVNVNTRGCRMVHAMANCSQYLKVYSLERSLTEPIRTHCSSDGSCKEQNKQYRDSSIRGK